MLITKDCVWIQTKQKPADNNGAVQQEEMYNAILAVEEEVAVWPVVKANEMAGSTPGDCGGGGVHSRGQITVIVNSE